MRTLICFRLCLVLFFLTVQIFSQTDNEQSVRETATKFCEAIQQKSIENLRQVFPIPDSDVKNWKNEFEKGTYAQSPLKSFTIQSVKIDGERARVRVFWERFNSTTKEAQLGYGLNHRVLFLQKQVSGWKIVGIPTAENELISQIVAADSPDKRKQIIREEKELNTFRMLYVILFRLQNEGNFELAEEYFDLAKWYGDEFYKQQNEVSYNSNLINLLNSRAASQKAQGNYPETFRFYQEAAEVGLEFQKKTGKTLAGVALTEVNLGELYFQQGNIEQAERFANFALKNLEGADRVKQSVVFHSVYNLLGDIYSQKDAYEKAIEYYHQAGDTVSLGIGTIYLKQNNLAEALKIFQYFTDLTEHSETAKEQVDLPLAVEAFSSIAEIYLWQGETKKARQTARRAVEFAEKSKNPELIYLARTVEGKALLANNQSSEAENAFRLAIETVEAGRQKVIGGEQSKISFFENRVEPYQKMVKLLVQRNDTPTALNFAERAKSRVLNEILQVGRIEWQKVLIETDKQKEQALHAKLTELNRLQTVLKYQTEIDKTRIADLSKQLEQVRLDYEFLQTSAFANYPELRRSRGISINIKAEEIASLIRQPNEALLEFAVSDDKIYLFAATKEKTGTLNLQVYPLDGQAQEIIALVNDFRQRIIEKNLDFKEPARKLYQVLFQKASAQLAGKTNLTIVPDAELWNLPFAALISPDNHFLIESKTLNFAQSLTALKELQKIKTNNAKITGSLLAVGNPRLDEKTIAQVHAQYRGDIGDLPEAEAEVLELQKLYGKNSQILTKADAREDLWKAEAGQYRILHLATHGLANSNKPLYSHLVLATDSNKTTDDGLLEAWEVMNLRLNADLAVLSACETAYGQTNKGEGLIGLSWVFAVAGVPLVVASQWKVDSLGTAELMVEFHRQMRVSSNNPVSKSLQSAMRSQLKKSNRSHPFFWAGFISIGKN